MHRIRHLKIDAYRNVEPCELEFADGMVVVLGKNGTGKTTLLDLLGAIVSDDYTGFPVFGTTRFATEIVPDEGAPARVRFAKAHAPQPAFTRELAGVHATNGEHSLEVSMGDRPPLRWTAQNGDPLHLSFADNLSIGAHALGGAALDAILSRTDSAEHAWLPHATLAPGRLDEALDTFRALTDHDREPVGVERTPDGPMLHVAARQLPQAIRIALRAQSPGESRAVARVEDDAPLREFAELTGLAPRDLSIDLLGHGHDTGLAGRPVERWAGLRWWFALDSMHRISHDDLSFGEKRLLTFGYHADAAPHAPLVADELVNGLHYDWLRHCIGKLDGRQSFLSAQNPVLLDLVPIAPDIEKVRRSFVTCRATKDAAGGRRLSWQNLTSKEANDFLRAYGSGIASVSEVLRDLDLW